ncbi:signal peptidase I [Enterococcus sp. 7E2_DIV0204]|uniref:signal peptidase I n=1 Tax=unclassified Enterococcus TaxID=2608891 RepID=UPI000B6B28DE|nr:MULTISPECIES: signal peptidase I [unclassified Enterococcus]OTN84012.1 signal peptidase I [Enterococcus sp. 7E2_DIV0204]OTP47210.1 signal peptidase I [Enterococcus sp. 7D2_DIV0200]
MRSNERPTDIRLTEKRQKLKIQATKVQKEKKTKNNSSVESSLKKAKSRFVWGSKPKRSRQRINEQIKLLFVALVLGSILVMGLSLLFFRVLTVNGYSMVPTLREKDNILIQKNSSFRRFDIVAFTFGDRNPQIRRIIGLPSETITYKQDTLFVNEQLVDEKVLIDSINESQKNGRNYTEDFEQKVHIPEGYYFVLGDNRPYATDSRHYGLIAKERLLGKVIMQLSPLREFKNF